ncbi:MAG: hypothetical protein HQL57_08590 [Magnetococcales bacterium]|nr:hypothetical protein [Magnetococcales bacterium]
MIQTAAGVTAEASSLRLPDALPDALIEGEKGRHFDPGIVAVFFANLDDILEIRESLKD